MTSLQSPRPSRADELADRAVRALIAEALLTPKPALVDQRGRGAHRDLDLERLVRSAEALRDGFRAMVDGEPVRDLPAPGSYVEITRAWKSGDAIELSMPKTLRLEPL